MSSTSSSSSSEDEEDKPNFRLPLRMSRTRKFEVADDVTLSKILSKTSGRPKPEFEGEEYIPPGESKDKLLFKCREPNCKSAFANEAALKSHGVSHRDRKTRCAFCNMTFKTEEERTGHLNEFHPDLEKTPDTNPLQCKKCGKISRDKTALWRHVKDSHPGPPTPCKLCGVLFKRVDNLKEHMKYKHPAEGAVPNFPCTICQRDFLYKTSLRLHVKNVHRGEENRICCVICNTSYGCKMSYNLHMRRHINPTFYPCEICKTKFRTSSKLKRHFESSIHKKMVRKWGKGIPASALNQIRAEKPNEVKKRKSGANPSLSPDELIDLCRKSLPDIILHRVDQDQVDQRRARAVVSSTRKQEMRKYHNLDCIYCHERQPSLEEVKKHEAICYQKSRSAKLVICPTCDMEFDRPFKLRKHMATHSDVRPFTCSHCDLKFKTDKAVEMHEKRIHFGIRYKPKTTRVYSCNYSGCTKKYQSAEHLKHHVAGCHLGVRYDCKVCGKKIKAKHHLKKHMKTVHEEKPTLLVCRPCNRAYKGRHSMLLHYTTRRHRLKVREMRRAFAKKKKDHQAISSKEKLIIDP